MKLSRILAISATGLAGLIASGPAFAQEAAEVANPLHDMLFLGADILNLALVAASVIILTLVIGRNGKSELSTIFASFIVASLLLGACRLFLLLASKDVFAISDDGMNFCWHIIFYLAMITFIWGARSLVKLAKEGESGVSNYALMTWSAIAAISTVLVFFGAGIIDGFYANVLQETLFQSLGGMHFIAFVLAGIAAFYVFQRTKVGALTKVLATPFLISIGLMSLQHFWELLSESWKVVEVSSDVIEQIELLFVVPAYILLGYAFFRLYRVAVAPSA